MDGKCDLERHGDGEGLERDRDRIETEISKGKVDWTRHHEDNASLRRMDDAILIVGFMNEDTCVKSRRGGLGLSGTLGGYGEIHYLQSYGIKRLRN